MKVENAWRTLFIPELCNKAVRFGEHRTTISMDEFLVELLSIRLTGAPGDRSKVRDWIESTLIDRWGNSKGAARGASRAAQRYAIEFVADKELSKRYRDYRLGEEAA